MDERGSVTAEYTVVLVLISVSCGLALVGLGPLLARLFLAQISWLLLPYP